jgi:hypothetical protein
MDLKGYVASQHDKKLLVDQCKMIERNKTTKTTTTTTTGIARKSNLQNNCAKRQTVLLQEVWY